MKFFVFLLSVLALIACSDSENVVFLNDSDLTAQEGSSSSAEDLSSSSEIAASSNAQLSSSVVQLSSSSVQSPSSSELARSSSVARSSSSSMRSRENRDFSSSSFAKIFTDSTQIPSVVSCAVSKRRFPWNDFNYYEFLINIRANALVTKGASTEGAVKTAKDELYKTLGIDTLIENTNAPFTRRYIRDVDIVNAVNYVFFMDSTGMSYYAQDFAETGMLDRLDYCGAWKGVPWFLNSGDDETIYSWARTVGVRGCAVSNEDIENPYLIFSNIHRKCLDLPYCTDELFGTVKRIGFGDIINEDPYVCTEKGWNVARTYDRDLEGIPCDKIGEVRKSTYKNNLFYICKEDGWNVAPRVAYETRNFPCDTTPQLVRSPTIDTLYYLCKDSKWKVATHMEASTFGIPCDRDNLGKIVKSIFKEESWIIHFDSEEMRPIYTSGHYICRDTGWDDATSREVDIGERFCDVDGERIQGINNTLMYYVCYNDAWTEFYKAPCDTNNKRVSDPIRNQHYLYICYDGKWYASRTWNCELPREYYLNPDVEYGTLVDERDGEMYKTVDVFGVTWMAENLRYVTADASQSVAAQDGCEIAGRYYSKDAAPNACPAGWRLPDSIDINALVKTPEFQSLNRSGKDSYMSQFMSVIGHNCNSYECNVYGTSFLDVGFYDKGRDKFDNQTHSNYWVYGDVSTKEVFFKFFNIWDDYYRSVSQDDYVPIRCVKEYDRGRK